MVWPDAEKPCVRKSAARAAPPASFERNENNGLLPGLESTQCKLNPAGTASGARSNPFQVNLMRSLPPEQHVSRQKAAFELVAVGKRVHGEGINSLLLPV